MAGQPDDDELPTMASDELRAAVQAAKEAVAARSAKPAGPDPEGADAEGADADDRTMDRPPETSPGVPAGQAKPSRASLPGDDSVTVAAPRVAGVELPVPTDVKIRSVSQADIEDEFLVETEVRTMPGLPESPSAKKGTSPADAEPDSITAQAPAHPVPLVQGGPMPYAPPVRPAAGKKFEVAEEDDPTTTLARPQLPPPRASASANAQAAAPAINLTEPLSDYGEESVTTMEGGLAEARRAALASVRNRIVASSEDDETQANTETVTLPAPAGDAVDDSVTARAPAHAGNVLRVVSTDAAIPIDTDPEDDLPGNRTAVMAEAPGRGSAGHVRNTAPLEVSPAAARSSGRAVAAPKLERTSDSGLRVARGSGSGEHSSLGAIMSLKPTDVAHAPSVGSMRSADPHDQQGSGPVQLGGPDASLFGAPPALNEVDFGRGPRYGLIVALVATVSIAIPVGLFFALNRGPDDAPVHVPAQPSSNIVKRDDALRGKTPTKTAPSASASAKGPPRWPFHH